VEKEESEEEIQMRDEANFIEDFFGQKIGRIEKLFEGILLSNSNLQNQTKLEDQFVSSESEFNAYITDFWDEKLLEFSKLCFMNQYERIKQANIENVTIQYRNFFRKYSIFQRASKPANNVSSLIFKSKDQKNGSYYILCKGDADFFLHRLSLHVKDQTQINNVASRIKAKGFKPVVVAYRKLNQLEAEFILNFNHSDISFQDKNSSSDNFPFASLHSNLKLLGIIGINLIIDSLVPISVMKILAHGYKIWLMSPDNKETTLAFAQKIAFMKDDCQLILLSEEDDAKIIQQIKNIMNDIWALQQERAFALDEPKPSLLSGLSPSSSRFLLLLNGHSIAFLESHQFLLFHFKFLLSFFYYIIVYNLDSQNKTRLLRLLHQHYPLSSTFIMDFSSSFQFSPLYKGLSLFQPLSSCKLSPLIQLQNFLFQDNLLINQSFFSLVEFAISFTFLFNFSAFLNSIILDLFPFSLLYF